MTTGLRNRMLADIRSAGLAASTQEVYIHSVRGLAAYYWRSPDMLSEAGVRAIRGALPHGALLERFLSGALPHGALLERYMGGTVGMLAVLHTWTQQLLYHPHVHCPMSIARCPLPGDWRRHRGRLLASGASKLSASLSRPGEARARQAHGRTRQALPRAGLAQGGPAEAMGCPLHTVRIRLRMRIFQSGKLALASLRGEGADAVLRYLARYVFRTAITSSRIESLDGDRVTFRHKHRASNRWRRTCWRRTRLAGHEFMRRFLQHVLQVRSSSAVR